MIVLQQRVHEAFMRCAYNCVVATVIRSHHTFCSAAWASVAASNAVQYVYMVYFAVACSNVCMPAMWHALQQWLLLIKPHLTAWPHEQLWLSACLFSIHQRSLISPAADSDPHVAHRLFLACRTAVTTCLLPLPLA